MKTKKVPYIWIAPIITLAIMLVLYAIAGVFPFGTSTTAFGDALAQYIPMMSEFAEKIREGGSLLFSWHIGAGINFWTNIAYYLASPLNLIVLFFEPSDMDRAFALITLIKPVLMALTFAIYLKYVYQKNDLSVTIFSVLWSLSAFMINAIHLTSWYDSIIYFPLVILGLKRLMDGKSALLYSVFLGLSIISNFYIGWIICIFCVIYFIYSFIADDEVGYEGSGLASELGNDDTDEGVNIFAAISQSYLLKTFFKFILSSLVAGALSAIFTLPAFFSLSNTSKSDISDILIVPKSVFGLLASHIYPTGNNYYVMSSPNYIYALAGIVTLILAVAFFFTKKISKRKKLGNLFLLGIMWISIVFYFAYSVWHGFAIPAGIMYRFGFVYIFVLIKIAYEAYINIKDVSIYAILIGSGIAILCTAAGFFDETIKKEIVTPLLICTIFFFIVLYTVMLFVMRKKTKFSSMMSVALIVCIVGEVLFMNYDGINTYDVCENLEEYKIVNEVTSSINASDKMLFQSQKQTFNDSIMYGALFGYNSYDCYSSMVDGDFTLTANFLGSHGNGMNQQLGAQEQTPIYNFIFPIDYYLDGSGNLSESYFRTKVNEKDGYSLYKMNYKMPFMYTISNSIVDWNPFSFPVPIDGQNQAAKLFTGTNDDILVYNENKNIKYENCKHISTYETMCEKYRKDGIKIDPSFKSFYNYMESRMVYFSYEIDDMSKHADISFDSVATKDGMMYIYINVDEFTSLQVEINSEKKEYYAYGIGENRLYELGEVKAGDTVKVKVGGYKEKIGDKAYIGKESNLSACCFTVDKTKLDNAYNKLDAMSDTEMLEFSDTHVKAKVTSNEDGMLYIPTTYDEGWKILIDGVEAPLYEHESHILMTEITKGEHTVEMNYMPVGFVAGAVITGVSAAILIAWAVISYNRFKKERKSGMILANDVNEG